MPACPKTGCCALLTNRGAGFSRRSSIGIDARRSRSGGITTGCVEASLRRPASRTASALAGLRLRGTISAGSTARSLPPVPVRPGAGCKVLEGKAVPRVRPQRGQLRMDHVHGDGHRACDAARRLRRPASSRRRARHPVCADTAEAVRAQTRCGPRCGASADAVIEHGIGGPGPPPGGARPRDARTAPDRRPDVGADARARRRRRNPDRPGPGRCVGCRRARHPGPPGKRQDLWRRGGWRWALVGAGLKVGVTANSHKVIGNFVTRMCALAEEAGRTFSAVHAATDEHQVPDHPWVRGIKSSEAASALRDAKADVGGRRRLALGQGGHGQAPSMSSSSTRRASTRSPTVWRPLPRRDRWCCSAIPEQLEQPIKGQHPPGAEASVLGHVLGDQKTISAEQGLFLPKTRRLHPDICAFTSELFYEDKLSCVAGLELQGLEGNEGPRDLMTGTGLRVVPVQHEGNQNAIRRGSGRGYQHTPPPRRQRLVDGLQRARGKRFASPTCW